MKKVFTLFSFILMLLLSFSISLSAEETNDFVWLSEQQKEWISTNYSSFGDDTLLALCQWGSSSHYGYLIYKSDYTGGNVGAVVRVARDGSTSSASLTWTENNLYSNNDIYLINSSSHQYNAFACGDDLTFNFDSFACEVPNPNQNYTISTSVSPSGSGSVSGGGTYESGSNVTLTATANDGYRFVSWNNGLTDNPINITANSNASYTAYFELIEEPTPPTPPSSDNLILQVITYTNAKVFFEVESNSNASSTTYLYYDVNVTYYGVGLDIYYSLDDQSSLIQSNIDKFSYTYSYSKSNSCVVDPPCAVPSLPNTRYSLASSFTSDNYTILPSSDSGAIEVINPSLDNLISNGNDLSQGSKDNLDSANNSLNSTINQYNQFDQEANQDLIDDLNAIDLNDFAINGLIQLSNSSNFVRTQFNNLTANNPIGTSVGFALVVGLSLLLLAKRL